LTGGHGSFTSASWQRATIPRRMWGPYTDVLVLGAAVLVVTWLSQAWIIGAICLAMTLGVALAAALDR
jgi:hypothetical protein